MNSLAADFAALMGVSNDTIQKRMKAKECLNCGSNAHQMRSCPKVRKARVNSVEVEDEHEGKNE